MGDSEGFLRAIAEDPEDDVPRLVFADWLEERGDSRGEFMRLQVHLARFSESDRRRVGLEARERELLDRHAVDWLGPLRNWSCGWRFVRGLLALEIDAEALLAIPSGEQEACSWVERVKLWRLPERASETLAELKRFPHLSAL